MKNLPVLNRSVIYLLPSHSYFKMKCRGGFVLAREISCGKRIPLCGKIKQ